VITIFKGKDDLRGREAFSAVLVTPTAKGEKKRLLTEQQKLPLSKRRALRAAKKNPFLFTPSRGK